jgi:hypothetical protein
MLSAAFPAHANQQAGWEVLNRIHDAYARLARSIRPSILEALRTMRIPSSRDSQPLLNHLATMREYGKIAFADIASVKAQDMLFDILIAALTDDPRFAAFVPNWYSQATDDSSGADTATSQPFDNLCDILRNYARLMTSRTIQTRAARRESNDQPRSEDAYRGELAYYGAKRNRRSPSPSSHSRQQQP